VVTTRGKTSVEWAFLLHRLPRDPSAPRIQLWRSLRRLGAVLVGDGVVALPADARTIEHLEWLAAGVRDSGGEASVWLCRPTTRETAERLAARSREAVDDEYRAVERQAVADEGVRAQARLRRQLRAIESRDFFGAPSAQSARAAVEALGAKVSA
jgi:hypothetical protein